MIQRGTRIAIEVIAGLIGVVVLLVGMSLWRLSTGPIELDFLTPAVETALSDPDGGLSVRVGRTELTWGGWDKTLDLHTRDVRIQDEKGFTLAALPDIVVRLSLRALVQGSIAPTVVEVIGARLNLVRGADGSFEFDRWHGETQEALIESDMSQVLPSVIERLMSSPEPGEPLSYLTAVRIVGGQVGVNDRKLGRYWQAPLADIELRRNAAGLAGEIAMVIALGDTYTNFTGSFLFDRDTGRIDLSSYFTDLHPAALSSVAPQLEKLGGLSTPLDGSLSASLGVDGRVESMSFRVSGGSGTISLPELLPEAVPLLSSEARGSLSGPDRSFELESAVLRLGTEEEPGPVISVAGSIVSEGAEFAGDLDLDAEITVRGITLDEFPRYWPESMAINARRWVLRNMPRGVVDEMTMVAALHLPGGALDLTEIGKIEGTLSYRDLEVHYFQPLPAVTAVAGTATFDHTGFMFHSEGGKLLDLEVGPSTVDIRGLDTAHQELTVKGGVVGPLSTILKVLDHDRLKLVRRLDIDPATTEGELAAQFEFEFPLLNALVLEEVDMAVKANLERVTIREFILGLDAENGSLSLWLDKSGMGIKGPFELAGVPLDIEWQENFSKKSDRARAFLVRASRLDDADRKVLGLDLVPYLEGPVSATVRYGGDRAGKGKIEVAVNLEDARLAFSALSWEKLPGVSGEVHLTLGMQDGKLTEVSEIDVQAGTLIAQGTGTFDERGKALQGLRFEQLAFDRSRLTDVTVGLNEPALSVNIGGGVLDAAWLLGGETDESAPESASIVRKEEKGESASGSVEASAAAKDKDSAGPNGRTPVQSPRAKRSFMPLDLRAARLDAVYVTSDRYLEDVALYLRRSRAGWKGIRVEGKVPRKFWSKLFPVKSAADERVERENGTTGGEHDRPEDAKAQAEEQERAALGPESADLLDRSLRIDFRPKPGGGYALEVIAEDMGGVLRALDRMDTMQGGSLVIRGEADGPLPLHLLEARIEARDYLLIEAPRLAKLLSLASLTGFVDSLRGEGLRFERIVGDFTLLDGQFETDLIRAYGSALGITAKGRIDFDQSLVDLKGTVVPAYTINRILGSIPLLGPILTGGEGEGLLAVTYSMDGPLSDPEVNVNPLSALAPGFLRGLFSAGSSNSDKEKATVFPERADP